jgi:hypothetical protein
VVVRVGLHTTLAAVEVLAVRELIQLQDLLEVQEYQALFWASSTTGVVAVEVLATLTSVVMAVSVVAVEVLSAQLLAELV